MASIALLRACACGVALSIVASGARAGMIEVHTSETYSSITDWEHTYQLPQFDDMGGQRTLLSVTVTLNAEIDASAETENLESWANSIVLTLDATISLSFLDEILVAPAGISRMEKFNAGPFDGLVDFQGVSGGFFDLSGSALASTSRTGVDDLAPWTGTGTVDLVGAAHSLSTADGPGNVVNHFMTDAAGTVTVRYEYVPTPGAWTLLAASLGVIAPRRRSRAA